MSTQRVNRGSIVNEMQVIGRKEMAKAAGVDGSSGARMDGGPHPVAMAGHSVGFFTFKPSGAVFHSFSGAGWFERLANSGANMPIVHRMDSGVAPFVVHGVSK
jgi:hypothetical protein